MTLVFPASLHRISKSADGEVTVTLKVPKSHAGTAIQIPEETLLQLTIDEVPA